MAQYTVMSHLLQRHYSVLPAGKSYADILSEGIGAAMALGMVEVQREARCPRQILEFAETMPATPQVLPEMLVELRGGNIPVDRFSSEPWGIGRGLPKRDMQP